jgi:hypothetical protein
MNKTRNANFFSGFSERMLNEARSGDIKPVGERFRGKKEFFIH